MLTDDEDPTFAGIQIVCVMNCHHQSFSSKRFPHQRPISHANPNHISSILCNWASITQIRMSYSSYQRIIMILCTIWRISSSGKLNLSIRKICFSPNSSIESTATAPCRSPIRPHTLLMAILYRARSLSLFEHVAFIYKTIRLGFINAVVRVQPQIQMHVYRAQAQVCAHNWNLVNLRLTNTYRTYGTDYDTYEHRKLNHSNE